MIMRSSPELCYRHDGAPPTADRVIRPSKLDVFILSVEAFGGRDRRDRLQAILDEVARSYR